MSKGKMFEGLGYKRGGKPLSGKAVTQKGKGAGKPKTPVKKSGKK